jgi:hypothetical protein
VARKNQKYRLIGNEQVRPCFFSGTIDQPDKVVTISLSPTYTAGCTTSTPFLKMCYIALKGANHMAYIATFQGTAAVEHIAAVRASMLLLQQESQAQPGTLRYEFYQSTENPAVFLLLAIWEEQAAH